MSVWKNFLHCFHCAILAFTMMLVGLIFHSEAFAQVPQIIDATTTPEQFFSIDPKQMPAVIANSPIEGFHLFLNKLKPSDRRGLKEKLKKPDGQQWLKAIPEEHANALKNAAEQTGASSIDLPPLPTKDKPITKLYLNFHNRKNIFFEAVTEEQEKAKRAKLEEQVKQIQNPFYATEGSKYIPHTMEFVLIKAGSFLMGSNPSEEKRLVDEQRHEVQITKDFYMGCFEVTQEQWTAVTGKNVRMESLYDAKGNEIGKIKCGNEGAGYPIFNINHEEAMDFCKKLTSMYRSAAQVQDRKKYYILPEDFEFSLPTEAQWEFACRAGNQTRFSDGDNLLGRDANYNFEWIRITETSTKNKSNNNNNMDNTPQDRKEKNKNKNDKEQETLLKVHQYNIVYKPRLLPVGTRNPNAWGLYDMHGNVWEWCKGCYYIYPKGGKLTDPQGMRSGGLYVVRGGSWYSYAQDCRSARRYDIDGGTRQDNIGFRVVIVKK